MNLRVDSATRATLTLPKWSPWSEGLSFLASQTSWLDRKTKKFPRITKLSRYFSSGGLVWLDGTARRVCWTALTKNTSSKPVCEVAGDSILFSLSGADSLEPALLDACRLLAAEYLPPRLSALGQSHGLSWNRLRLGNQKSRWGSCSAKGTISLNWRLILLPLEVGNYVLCHELAHLRHMNHSPEFWNFLEGIAPGAKALDRRLGELGKGIMGLARTP